MIGWLPAPPVSKLLVAIALAFVVFSAPIGSWKVFSMINNTWPEAGATIRPIWREFRLFEESSGFDLRGKTDFGLMRYLHFLSLAYLAWVAVGPGGARLVAMSQGAGRWLLAVITKVGQQSHFCGNGPFNLFISKA